MARWMVAGQFPEGLVPLTYSTSPIQFRKRHQEVLDAHPGLHVEVFTDDVGGPVLWEVTEGNFLRRNDVVQWRELTEPELRRLLHPLRDPADVGQLATATEVADQLEQACTAAWNEHLEPGGGAAALEAAAVVVEDYLSARGLPLAGYNSRDIAVDALALTPAQLQSIEPWCPGYGDEQDCDIDVSNPCAACRSAGAAQDR